MAGLESVDMLAGFLGSVAGVFIASTLSAVSRFFLFFGELEYRVALAVVKQMDFNNKAKMGVE